MKQEYFSAVFLTVTMLLVGVGTMLFVISGVRWTSMQKLLKEGDYALRDQRKTRIKENVGAVYWLSATALYLGWSFLTDAWKITWVVWPIAGILFAVVMCLCNLLLDRKE